MLQIAKIIYEQTEMFWLWAETGDQCRVRNMSERALACPSYVSTFESSVSCGKCPFQVGIC